MGYLYILGIVPLGIVVYYLLKKDFMPTLFYKVLFYVLYKQKVWSLFKNEVNKFVIKCNIMRYRFIRHDIKDKIFWGSVFLVLFDIVNLLAVMRKYSTTDDLSRLFYVNSKFDILAMISLALTIVNIVVLIKIAFSINTKYKVSRNQFSDLITYEEIVDRDERNISYNLNINYSKQVNKYINSNYRDRYEIAKSIIYRTPKFYKNHPILGAANEEVSCEQKLCIDVFPTTTYEYLLTNIANQVSVVDAFSEEFYTTIKIEDYAYRYKANIADDNQWEIRHYNNNNIDLANPIVVKIIQNDKPNFYFIKYDKKILSKKPDGNLTEYLEELCDCKINILKISRLKVDSHILVLDVDISENENDKTLMKNLIEMELVDEITKA